MSRTRRYVLFSALLLLLLSACAPGVRGTSVHRPLELGSFEVNEVSAGQIWYLEDVYSPRVFGFSESELDQRLSKRLAYNPHRTEENRDRVTNVLSIEGLDIPEGWNVELARATLIRKVSDVDTEYYYYRDSLELVFAVTIPEGTTPDIYAAVVSVRGRDGTEHPLRLALRVAEAAAETGEEVPG